MKRIYFSPMLFISLVSVLLFATFAHAATLEVGAGKPYTTIQSAINSAKTNDTVLVSPGTYTENVTFNGKKIIVKSVNGAANTTIDGNASGSVVTFANGEDVNSMLDGFTITNGTGTILNNPLLTYGGGIACYLSSPTITNCIITGNTVTDSGGGIVCGYSSVTITNCTITGNTATGALGARGPSGGGIACGFNSSPTITNCTITGNTANESGGGMACDSTSSSTVKNTILWGDTAPAGKEIFLEGATTITVTYSDVEGGWEGTGNINADPLFVGNGNYHLKAGSPCIDAGTSDGAPSNDIDGDTRPQGAGYDMGSDEYTGASTACSVWSDVITKYNLYVSGQAQWNDVIDCYNQYAAPK